MTAQAPSTRIVFVVVDAAVPARDAPAREIGWAADGEEYGVTRPPPPRYGNAAAAENAREIASALAPLAQALRGGVAFLSDPLFEEGRLARAFAAGGLVPPVMRDWLLALAPYGQARDFAAIFAAVDARAPMGEGAEDRARRMLEVLHETRARCVAR